MIEEGIGDRDRVHAPAVLRHVHGPGEIVRHRAVAISIVGLRAGEAHAFDGEVGAEQVAAGAVDSQAAFGAVHEAVAQRQASAPTQTQRPLVRLAVDGHVGDGRVGAGQSAFVAFAVVRFDGVVGGVRLFDVEVLNVSGPAIRPVQRIVCIAREHDVLRIHRAAEELHAVVQVVVNLHVFHRRGVANRLEGDAVQLVLRVHVGTGETHAHVAQRAGVVVGVGTAEQTGVRLPFLGTCVRAAACALRAVVDRRVAVDDQAAPQPAVAVFGIAKHFGLGGEENGLFRRAIGDQSATALDDEEVFVGGADQHRARSQRDLAIGQCPAAARG